MSSSNKDVLWNRSFILCVMNYFIIFVYFYGLMTVLPFYIIDHLGGSLAQSGLAMTVFLASAILLRPFTGIIIQKLGRQRTLYISMILFSITAFAYLLIDSLESLLTIRFIQGIWFSLMTTVTVPIVNDFIPENRKGEGIGYYMMALNVAMVCGPAIGLVLLQHAPIEQLFWASAMITLISCLFGFLIPIQEPVKNIAQKRDTTVSDKVAEKGSDKMAAKPIFQLSDIFEKRVLGITIVGSLTALAYSSILNFISLSNAHYGLLSYTSVFFLIFAVSMLMVRPFTGKLYDRKGPAYVILPSMLIFTLGLALTSWMQSFSMLVVCAIVLGVGYSALFPGFQTIAIQSVEKARVGHATSTFFTGFDIGLAFGASLMGMILAWGGFNGVFLSSAVIMALTLGLYYRFQRAQRQPTA